MKKTSEKTNDPVHPNQISQKSLSKPKSDIINLPDDNTKEILQIAANALIAEYNAIRAASLARDQIFSTVANFGIVLMVAILASLPTVISQQRYQLLLPLFSIIASSLSLANLSQRWLLETLALYENDELKPRLKALFQQANNLQLRSLLNSTEYWQWQTFLKNDRYKGTTLYNINKRLASLAPALLPLFASFGFIFLFIYHRGFDNLTLPEHFLFYLSTIYSFLSLASYFNYLHDKKKSYT